MARDLNTIDEQASVRDSLNYQNASVIRQKITVDASDHDVTLTNPHTVCNCQAAAATIAIKLSGESAFMTEYFLGGQEKVMDAAEIGGTGEGSTSGTVVVIRGIV